MIGNLLSFTSVFNKKVAASKAGWHRIFSPPLMVLEASGDLSPPTGPPPLTWSAPYLINFYGLIRGLYARVQDDNAAA